VLLLHFYVVMSQSCLRQKQNAEHFSLGGIHESRVLSWAWLGLMLIPVIGIVSRLDDIISEIVS